MCHCVWRSIAAFLTIHGIAPAPDTIFAHLLPAHLAHVARGKACAVREIRLQKLCRCDRRALFRALTDGFTDGADFIHLRKFSGENFRKFSVHDTVIGRFFNVHGFSCNLRCRAWDVLLFYHISTVFRTLTRFSSQGLNGKYEACFVEANFIST